MCSFKIVIPTRNNARWLKPFLAAYRRIGIEPFYVVDARSTDETIFLLEEESADFVSYPGDPLNIVEGGILTFAASHMPKECPWTLRLDDDEFPSNALISWLNSGIKETSDTWTISRRDLLRIDGVYLYNRFWSMYHDPVYPDYLYGHVRLYKHDNVEFQKSIHRPGFQAYMPMVAPEAAYFTHLDVLLRSLSDRIGKLRTYERDHPGTSWRYGNHYLPEICPPAHLNAAPLGTDEFDDLLAAIPQAPRETRVELAVSELQTLRLGAFDRDEFKKKIEDLQAEIEDQRAKERGLANQRLGEFLCTISRVVPRWKGFVRLSKILHSYGDRIQYRAELRRQRTCIR